MSERTCANPRGVLVTGATGFIGRVLCERLRREGRWVRGVARTSATGPWDEFIALDLGRDVPSAILDGVDDVYHFAGRAHAVDEVTQDPEPYRRVAVEATRRLIDRSLEVGARSFVFLSSVKVLGEGGGERLDEHASPAPVSVYGSTKLEAETVVSAAATRGLHAVSLRLPPVYGAGCKGNLARMLQAVDRGRFPPLADYGNRRSMVHVNDVVQAAVLVAADPAASGKTYIVTDGQAYSTRQLYELMCEALGKRPLPWPVPVTALRVLGRLGDLLGRHRGRRAAFDSAALSRLTGSAWYTSHKIQTELGFAPQWTLARALPEMVAAMQRAA